MRNPLHLEATGRAALAALLIGLLALTGLAAAQATQPADAAAVYDLYQGGAHLGETGLTLQRSDDGTTSNAYVAVAGLFDVNDTLVTAADGSAVSYAVSGTVQGAPFSIEVGFDETGAHMTLEQGGAQQKLSISSDEPLYVFDNNFIDGYQIAADRVMATGAGRSFAAIVPQAAILGTVTLDAPREAAVEYLGEEIDATMLLGTLEVGGQTLDITLYLDDAGELLVLEQSPGAVRFERRAPATGADAAGADEEAAGAENAAADPATEAIAQDAACLVEREVEIGSTSAMLAGRLTLPRAAAEGTARPAPALLLLPGSGPTDVDGNSPPLIRNAGYQQLAYALACHGYAVLRIAKLGIPPSTGDANAVTLDTYASNAADWLAFLAEQPGVDPDRLGVIGHSEGGLIALYATATGAIAPEAVVLIATAGRPLGVVLREQLLASARRGGAAGAELAAFEDQVDEALEAVRRSEGTALDLGGELGGNQVAQAFAHAAGLLRSEIDQDPLELASSVDVPVVVLQGGKDIQVQPDDARLLADALPSATLLELPNMGHNLNEVAGDPLTGAIPAPTARVSRTLVQALATYLHGHLRVAR